MQDKIKQEFNDFLDRSVDYFFNNILTITTFVSLGGFVIHLWYPQYKNEYDTIVGAYLIHMRKNATS